MLPIASTNLFVPTRLGTISLIHENHEFFVVNPKGLKSPIQRCDLDREIRGISDETLEKMLEVGYLALNTVGNSLKREYAVHFNARLKGGGPFGAVGVFFTTWTAGLVITGVGSVLVATGVGAPAGAALIVTGATTMGVAAPLAAAAVIAPTP